VDSSYLSFTHELECLLLTLERDLADVIHFLVCVTIALLFYYFLLNKIWQSDNNVYTIKQSLSWESPTQLLEHLSSSWGKGRSLTGEIGLFPWLISLFCSSLLPFLWPMHLTCSSCSSNVPSMMEKAAVISLWFMVQMFSPLWVVDLWLVCLLYCTHWFKKKL